MNQALSIILHRIIGSFVTGLFQNILEQTKALVLVFVFVLVDVQAMTQKSLLSRFLHVHPALHCRVIFSLFSFVIWKCVEAEGLWR